MMATKEQLKIDVLLLLFEQPAGLPITSLSYEFLLFHGRPLDLQAHGYPSLGALLTDMSSMVELRSIGGGTTHTLRLLLRVPGQVEEPNRPQALAPIYNQPPPSLLGAPLLQGWPNFHHWVPVQPLPRAQAIWRPGAAAPMRSLVQETEGSGKPATRALSPVVPSQEADPRANGDRGHPMTYSEVLKSGGPAGNKSLAGCRPKVGPGLQAYKAGDPAAQAQDRRATEEQKVCPRGLLPDCPVQKWLLSVLKSPGYRDGLHPCKLDTLCLRQLHQEFSDFLSENRYGSLAELLARVPEVEMVSGHSGGVIRLRAGARFDGAAQPGPSLTESHPSALRPHAAPDPSPPQPAPSTQVTESLLERVSLLLAQHPAGLSTFQLRQAYREAYQRGLAVEGHPSLSALLGAMGSAVSVRGLGVQARLFPRSVPGCGVLAELETNPCLRVGVGTSSGSRQLSTGLPERTITETGFHGSTGLSRPS
ncbi:uncharacterized protein LOC132385493 [Hypanus sabinus]|uniref:uncharacterized protein LOC132385493 n=1 Tax=Hypanus sabinus TaxID=79690 RepID=UPI0028C37F11|nr:uncharacterized protein LOC132385493 [Hypanus sabinus]XP_059813586.1 uncharacterized protein LOC132385493 [Hypanus sabinus]